MGWLRRMRRVATWLRTQQGLLAVILSVVIAVMVATWFHLRREADRAAATNASRSAAVVSRDAAQEIERLAITLQTVVDGRQSAADTHLSQQERSTLLSERVPPSRYIDFVEVLGADGNVLASTRAGPE